MSSLHETLARTQVIFRDMNEWIEDANSERSGTDRSMGTYLCECSDQRCTDPISLTHEEYESIRAVPVRFAIATNHENPEIDLVRFENARFAAVEKFMGVAARIARATDPRR